MSAPSSALSPTPLPQDTGIQAARPLELFFDLVFVFAISQLARMVAHPHGWADYLQAGLAFASIAWMYGAYVWLTSNLDLHSSETERWSLLLGMLCFFGMAGGVAQLAQGSGVLFGVSLMAAEVLHYFTFRRMNNSSAQAIARLAPYNLATAFLVLVAVFLPLPWRWVVWGLASVPFFIPLLTHNLSQYPFSFSPRHFVERHGLLIIIALGEGVIALGPGVSTPGFSYRVMAYILSGLLLLASLWWAYFGNNQHDSEHQLLHLPPAERVGPAAQFSIAHHPLLIGCILVAASLEVGIHHPLSHTQNIAAWNIALGVAFFCAGLGWMRRSVALPVPFSLGLGAVLALASVPLGYFGLLWQVVALCAVLLWVGYQPKRHQ